MTPLRLRDARVVLVVAGERLGGAERGALDLALHLRDVEGASVALCALDDRPGRLRELAADAGVAWHVLRLPWEGGRSRKALALGRLALGLRRLRPDVLISTTNLPNVATGLTWRAAGARSALWCQCDVNGSTRIGEGLVRRALRSTPLVVTWASHAREWLAERYGADPDRVHVIRQPVALPPPRRSGAAWRAEVGARPGDLVGCMVAHLHEGKDHETALRAWRLVADALVPEGRRALLLLAGRDDGTEARVKALAFDLRLREHVRFLGEVDDVAGVVDASDLAVFCSLRECLPRGVAEPMAGGIPVAGVDIPGIREAVGAAGTRFLVPPGDAPALAAAVLELARDPALRDSVGRAGRDLIRSRQGAGETSRRFADLLVSNVPDLAVG